MCRLTTTTSTSKPAWTTWPARASKYRHQLPLLHLIISLRSTSNVKTQHAPSDPPEIPVWFFLFWVCVIGWVEASKHRLYKPIYSSLLRLSKKPGDAKAKKSKQVSQKYTAARLHEKGVLIEIEDLQTNQ